MKLSVLVPHYRETAEVIRPLLDSLKMQQAVDLSEIEVVVCNNGSEVTEFDFTKDLSKVGGYTLPDYYPFEIRQIRLEKNNLSRARNACLDAARGDYIMYCDADDMFMSVLGLWVIFFEIDHGGFDSFCSCFTEGIKRPNAEDYRFLNHNIDSTFVHGKVQRRQYLIDNGIRWNESLWVHEDSYFVLLCQNLTTNVKYCEQPFYLWRWRGDSECRRDEKYLLKTFSNLIDSNEALVDEFVKRGYEARAAFYVASIVYDTYYTLNKPEWLEEENREYREATEERIAKYFRKKKGLWEVIPVQNRDFISGQIKNRHLKKGLKEEVTTFDEWLDHIRAKGEKK